MPNDVNDKPAADPAPMQPQVSPAAQGISFVDIMQALALGISPQAPRLPEQSLSASTYFGGYQKGFTNKGGFRGSMTFQMLRDIAKRSMLIAACVSTRKHQYVRYSRVAQRSKRGEVGFRVVHARQHERDFQVPEGFHWLCRQAEGLIARPWRLYWDEGTVYREIEPTMAGFLSKIGGDLLVINRPTVELGLDPSGVPRAFGAIDGANVIPTFAAMKYLTSINRQVPRDYADNWTTYKQALQMIGDKYKLNLDERTQYIYMLQGKPTAAFRERELVLAPFLPSTDVKLAGYQESMVEQAIWAILAEIMAMNANSRYFELGSMAETLLAIKGNYTDPHIKQITDVLVGNVSGVPGMYRLPIIALPGGAQDLEAIQVKQNHKDMLFDVYIQKLTNLTCAVFRMHPSEINEAPRAGDNSGALTQASQKQQINMAQEQGLEASLEHFKLHIFDPILERIDPHLRLEWDYGRQEAEQLQIVQLYAPIATVNEQRAMVGLDEISDEDGGNLIDNPAILAQKQLDAQTEQQDKQMKAQQQAQASQQTEQAGQQQRGQIQQERDQESDQEMAQRVAQRQKQPKQPPISQPAGGAGRSRMRA